MTGSTFDLGLTNLKTFVFDLEIYFKFEINEIVTFRNRMLKLLSKSWTKIEQNSCFPYKPLTSNFLTSGSKR